MPENFPAQTSAGKTHQTEEKKSQRKRSKVKKKKIPMPVILFFFFAFIVSVWLVIDKLQSEADTEKTSAEIGTQQNMMGRELPFSEVENDSVQALMAKVMINKPGASLRDISEFYYKDPDYAGIIYVYGDNEKNIAGNMLDIPRNAVIRVPKIDNYLAMPDRGIAIARQTNIEIQQRIDSANNAKKPEIILGY
jgi:hypothetical protein